MFSIYLLWPPENKRKTVLYAENKQGGRRGQYKENEKHSVVLFVCFLFAFKKRTRKRNMRCVIQKKNFFLLFKQTIHCIACFLYCFFYIALLALIWIRIWMHYLSVGIQQCDSIFDFVINLAFYFLLFSVLMCFQSKFKLNQMHYPTFESL